MDFVINDLDHAAIKVRDLDRALEFYHDFLGLPVRDRDLYEAGEIPYVAVEIGGQYISMYPRVNEDFEFDADEHLCLRIRSDDTDSRKKLEEILSDLEDVGVEVVPLRDAGVPADGKITKLYGSAGYGWSAYVRDPDGRLIELKIH